MASSTIVSPPYRLAVLNSHPIQYFAPLYRRLAQESKIDLTVFYCSHQGVSDYVDPGFGTRFRWDVPLLEGYHYEFLPNLGNSEHVENWSSLVNLSIAGKIMRGRYDALWMHGHAYATDWLGIMAARTSGTPLFYRSESSLTFDARVHRPWRVRVGKPLFLGVLFRQVRCFLAIGTMNREFYLHYGARPGQIFHVPYTVDNDYFMTRADEFRSQRNALRAQLGFGPDDVLFLFAAKLTPKKAPLELLRSFCQLRDLKNVGLVIVGEGELRAQVEGYIREQELPQVRLVGFCNQSEMPRYYSLCDVFVRPDGLYLGDWGLTVNEAMASGLAILTTDGIGAAMDLVRDGQNGRVVPFGNLDAFAAAMRQLAQDPDGCRRMGEKSLELIQHWSNEQCVSGLLDALQSLSREGD